MHVRVDEAGRDDQVAGVERVAAPVGSSLCVGGDARDDAVLDVKRGRPLAVGKDHAVLRRTSIEVDLALVVVTAVDRLRNDPPPLRPTNSPFSITTRPRDSTVSVAPVTWRPSYGL